MKKITTLLCLIFLLLMGRSSSTTAQDNDTSDAPYIYYYSDILNAFIIERADGTQARILGEGLISDDVTQISGPGWSPSGEWFAWTSTTTVGFPGHAGYLPHVINQNGSSLNLFDDFVHSSLAWSPTEDLLMIVGLLNDLEFDESTGLTTSTIRIGLLDVAQGDYRGMYEGRAMFAFDSDHWNPFVGSEVLPRIYWTVDGSHAIVETDFDQNGFAYFLADNLVFDRTGSLQELVPAGGILHYGELTNGYGVTQNDAGDAYVFDNLMTGEPTEVSLQDYSSEMTLWHPTHDAVLVLAREPDCTASCGITLLSWEPGATTFTILDTSSSIPHLAGEVQWSPDGNALIIFDTANDGYIVNVTTGSIDPIRVSPIYSVEWTFPDRIMIDPHGTDHTLYEYSSVDHTIIHTFNIDNAYYLTPSLGRWSPDGTEFAFVNDGLVIQDTKSGTVSTFRPDGRSYLSINGGDVLWHSSGDWLLLGEDAVVAGGGREIWTSVVSRDGSLHRELGFCDMPVQTVCFDWLPLNTDTSKLPPAQPDPIFPVPSRTIHATNWSFTLSWSPDGHQLVRGAILHYSNPDILGPSTLFDVESGDAIADLEPMSIGEQTVEWVENDDGSYSPHIIDQTMGEWQDGGLIVATSPDGSRVAVVNDLTITFYETETGTALHSQDFRLVAVVSFSPDNSLVAISDTYEYTQIYDGATWELLIRLNTNATALAFSPDGHTLAVASSWEIQLWDVPTLLENVDDMSEE